MSTSWALFLFGLLQVVVGVGIILGAVRTPITTADLVGGLLLSLLVFQGIYCMTLALRGNDRGGER